MNANNKNNNNQINVTMQVLRLIVKSLTVECSVATIWRVVEAVSLSLLDTTLICSSGSTSRARFTLITATSSIPGDCRTPPYLVLYRANLYSIADYFLLYYFDFTDQSLRCLSMYLVYCLPPVLTLLSTQLACKQAQS